jgi:MYXO-CTERM domain-containing protein
MRRIAPWAALAVTLVLAPRAAGAFCGFYVDGAGAKLYNHATQVVLMRAGTRTVLSMQNNYQGPPDAFAMVVPVPVVLQKSDVRTLDRAVFDRIDALDAPRLVEYWEEDPCRPRGIGMGHYGTIGASRRALPAPDKADLGVTIEAQFVVGEYQVVVLSATDSSGLATWLEREKYAIPAGAAPYLRPYVEGGWKFFVAKVDPSKVTFENGMATLSPLRFGYDSDDFTLPVRLGLINSAGTQDLIVHVLSPAGRFELANRPNAFVPTNLDVKDEARGRFAELYAALFDHALATHPHAAITEYAWDARSCDPCPVPPLTESELSTLGDDLIAHGPERDHAPAAFTLTRLHVRYGKDELADDLVFRAAPAVIGGREERGADGRLDHDARAGGANAFQARYAIRHEWMGPITCDRPVRGRWGGPPQGAGAPPLAARGLAFAPRGKLRVDELLAGDAELEVRAAGAALPAPATNPRGAEPPPSPPARAGKGCGCGAGGDGGSTLFFSMMIAIAARARRRTQRERNR